MTVRSENHEQVDVAFGTEVVTQRRQFLALLRQAVEEILLPWDGSDTS